MELNNEQVVELIAGQARTEQAVLDISRNISDLKQSLLGGNGQKGAIPFLYEKHEALDKRVTGVEKKIYAASVLGGLLGTIASFFGYHMKH